MRYFVGGNDAFRELILGNRNTFSASTAAEWRYPGPHTMLRFAANTMAGYEEDVGKAPGEKPGINGLHDLQSILFALEPATATKYTGNDSNRC